MLLSLMEPPLQRAMRHVCEGAERIAEQRQRAIWIKEKGRDDLVVLAERILAQMEALHAYNCEHLASMQKPA